ncbi:MAG: type I restriction-modification system subunit M [Verrucomicrobia bacterium]|nr:type I restriction-modification system subunit M [Verrucomicrobiota bacterium]
MLTPEIKKKIDNLWDRFWSGGLSNPLTAMEQISYLLFMKRLDESDLKRKADAEWLKQEYVSVFDGHEEYRWSWWKQLEAEEMLSHVQQKVFPYIKTLQDSKEAEDIPDELKPPFTRHMKDAVFIIPKPSLLVEAVEIIDSIYAELEKEREEGQTFHDTQGDIYEYLLAEIASAGKNGQFRTPRHIIQMMAALVDPKLGDQVCDPAAGTGGFLLGAYQHILTQHTSEEHIHTDENGMKRGLVGDKLTDPRQWEVLREKTFYGYDFDSTMVRIGLMNLMLHGLDRAHVDYQDTLSKQFNEDDRYDVVLANPPFKGSIDKSDINEGLSLKTTKTELLFINRIINMLRIGGRAGVIVPDGVLFGSSNAHKAAREMLLDQCELQGVISMPSGVFKPYAGVSTAVLIFVKGGKTENVWYYDMQSDGYSLDDKRTRIKDNDIPDIIEKWKTKNQQPTTNNDRTARSFLVPADEIRENNYDLSINRYKEAVYEEVEYDPPKDIIKQLRKIESEISKELDELGEMLS